MVSRKIRSLHDSLCRPLSRALVQSRCQRYVEQSIFQNLRDHPILRLCRDSYTTAVSVDLNTQKRADLSFAALLSGVSSSSTPAYSACTFPLFPFPST